MVNCMDITGKAMQPENRIASCAPREQSLKYPLKEDIRAQIIKTLETYYPDFDDTDIETIVDIACIESNFNPWADNPTSSALGLYQFLDPLARSYFPKIGGNPNSCKDRCNVELATRAMAEFYKKELLTYWNSYISSGKTSIIGKKIKRNAHTARYASLTKFQWIYGLVHHDGVGNAVNGIDKGGINYVLSKEEQVGE